MEQTASSGPEIYRVCTRDEDARSLSDLCINCPIPYNIKSGIPRIIAEIEIQRQGNTEDGFIQYCKDALNNHVNKAAQFANDLANPVKRAGLMLPNVIEAKFWNLELCGLYKIELESFLPKVSLQQSNFDVVENIINNSYFHLTPEAISRRNKLRNEAHNAARRQAMSSKITQYINKADRANFIQEKFLNNKNINIYLEWLETKLFYLNQQLSTEEANKLSKSIEAEAAEIALILPYSDTYGPYFINKIKAESLLSVSEFLQFIREPWYPGLAGFYLFDTAEDMAYFRDIIIEHLGRQPKDLTPVMHRAIEWLTAEIERLSIPGAAAFRTGSITLPTLEKDDFVVDSTNEFLPIDKVLSIPRAALDRLLLDAAMVQPASAPGRYEAKPTVKPWQWANVRAALQARLLLAELSDSEAARLFTDTYGAVVSRGTMQQRPQDEQDGKHKTRRVKAYEEFCNRLPKPQS